MKTYIKKSLQGLLLVPLLALGVSAVTPVLQADVAYGQADGIRQGVGAAGSEDTGDTTLTLRNIIETAVRVLLFVVGGASIIMIIWGGFRYITSGGDSSRVTSAKNTILYAVIGLIVAVLSFAIVNFVLGGISGDRLIG